MQNINAIVMTIPARSPDLNPIENIFAQVSMILQNQAVKQNITKETFSEFSDKVKDTLIKSDREKINEVIDSKGQQINYKLEISYLAPY